MAVCKAKKARCNACGTIGHFKEACKKSVSNPKNSNCTGRMNIAAAINRAPMDADFFDEKGLPKTYEPPGSMNVLTSRDPDDKPVIQFCFSFSFSSTHGRHNI